MIPARLGSRRVPRKNARPFCGQTLLEIAIRKAVDSSLFDHVVVNSPDEELRQMARNLGVSSYARSRQLDTPSTTNQMFVDDYLSRSGLDPKSRLYMLNTTSPLLSVDTIRSFVKFVEGTDDYDTVLTTVEDKGQYVMKDQPINFSYDRHIPSEELVPLKRLTWGISCWKVSNFDNDCGIYAGKIGYFNVPNSEAIDIDTEEDWKFAEQLYQNSHSRKDKIRSYWTNTLYTCWAHFGGE